MWTETTGKHWYERGLHNPAGVQLVSGVECDPYLSWKDAVEDEVIPDYLHDLNAMHEAEGVLSCHQFHDYGKHLERVLFSVALTSYSFHDLASFAHATAAQRAEAFLRTIGKWEDGK